MCGVFFFLRWSAVICGGLSFSHTGGRMFALHAGGPVTAVSRFKCVSSLSVYPFEIRSVNNLSSNEDCSTDYCQPV